MEFSQVLGDIKKKYDSGNIVQEVKDYIDKSIGISTDNDFVDDEGNKLFEFDVIGQWSFDNEKDITTAPTGAGYSISCCSSSQPKTIQVSGFFFDYANKTSEIEKKMSNAFSTFSTLSGIIGVDTDEVMSHITTAYSYIVGISNTLLSLSQMLYNMLSVSNLSDLKSKIFNNQKRSILKITALEKLIDSGVIFNLQPYGLSKKGYVLKHLSYNISPTQTEEKIDVSLSFQEYIKSNDNLYGDSSSNGRLSKQMEQQKQIAEAQSKNAEETALHSLFSKAKGFVSA